MSLIGALIIFSGGLILGSGLIVLFRHRSDRVGQIFFFLTLIISLWTISFSFYRTKPFNLEILHYAQIVYVFAFLMVFCLWLLSNYYPTKTRDIARGLFFGGVFYTLFISVIIFQGKFVNSTIIIDNEFVEDKYNLYYYYFYIFVIVLYVVIALKNFLSKMDSNEGFIFRQSRVLILGLSISALSILFFNLLLPYYGIFYFDWLGPLSLLPIVVSVAYIMTKK